MTAITFPTDPANGELYTAPNGCVYIWDGEKWVVNSTIYTGPALADISQDRVAPMFVNGVNTGITFTYNETTNTLTSTVTDGDRLVNGAYTASLGANGVLTLPDGSIINGATLKTIAGNYAGITAGPASPAGRDEDSWVWVDNDGATISTKTSTDNHQWKFDNTGNLQLPVGGDIVDSTGTTVLGGGGSGNSINNGDHSVSVGSDGVVTMSTSRGTVEFGALPECGGTTHFHIMKGAGQNGSDGMDLYFGDDFNYVLQRADSYNGSPAYGVEIGAQDLGGGGSQHVWRFNTDGDLYIPPGKTIRDAMTGDDLLNGSGTSIQSTTWVQDFETSLGAVDVPLMASSVEYLANGDVVALFYHSVNSDSNTYSGVARFDSYGTKVWSMKFEGNDGDIYANGWGLAVDNNNGFIYVAGVKSAATGYQVAILTKLSEIDGGVVWSKQYDVGYANSNLVVDVASDGSPVVVGYASNGTDRQVVTTKINATDGSVTWSRALDGQGDEDAYGMAVGYGGEVVSVGYMAQHNETVSHSVTPLTGSTTDVLIINKSDLGGDTSNTWLVSGTGITGTIGVTAINGYTGLTGTVREGTGATFNIINNGNGTYSAGIETGGTNYRVGHKIKILGTSLTGAENTTTYTEGVDWTGANVRRGADTIVVNLTETAIIAVLTTGTVLTDIDGIGETLTITGPGVEDEGDLLYPTTGTTSISIGTSLGQFTIGNGTYATGATPANDIVITVDSITGSGIIDGVSNTGTAAGTSVATAIELPGANYNVGSGLTFDFAGPQLGTDYSNYQFNITAGGTNYQLNDVVVIAGTDLGGTSPANDLTLTVIATSGVVGNLFNITGTSQNTTYRIRISGSTVDFGGVGTWTLSGTVVDFDDRILVVKYLSDGTIDWQKAVQVETGYVCKGADADIDGSGNIYVCGNFDYDNVGNTEQAIIMFKFDSAGVKQWSRKVQGNCEDFAASIVVGPDNYLYLSAVTGNNSTSDYSMVIAKYNTNGTVVWQRLLDNTTTWTFSGSLFFNNSGGSNLAVRNGYVAVSGSFGDPGATPHAVVAQVTSDGTLFTAGDYDFIAASFSGVLDSAASNITVTGAGKTDSDYIEEFTTSNFSPTVDLTSDLIGTQYSSTTGTVGTVKLISPGSRKIEEVYGYNSVSVTSRNFGSTVTSTAALANTGATYSIPISVSALELADLVALVNGTTGYYFEVSLDQSSWRKASYGGYNSTLGSEYFIFYLTNSSLPVSQGQTAYYRIVTGADPVVWWDAATLPNGDNNFRGATIDYHAYTGESTIIGTIHIVNDSGEEHISHSEVQSGSTDGENDNLWVVLNEGTISYRRVDGESKTLKVQWTAKVFYGSEYYDD